MAQFSIGAVLRKSFEVVWNNLWLYWLLALVYAGTVAALYLLDAFAWTALQPTLRAGLLYALSAIFVFFATYVVGMAAHLGYLKELLNVTEQRDVNFNIFASTSFNLVLNGAIAGFFAAFAFFFGLILFIVPGIYWALKFGLYDLCLVDKNLAAGAALRMSAELTKGVKWQFLFLYLILGAVLSLSSLTPFGWILASLLAPCVEVPRMVAYCMLRDQKF